MVEVDEENVSEMCEARLEAEYDKRKISFKSVSTKRSSKRSKSISTQRKEQEHEACCSKKNCLVF